jgi:Transposase zinc-ribbon domain
VQAAVLRGWVVGKGKGLTARLSALYVVFPAGAWATRGRVEACNGEARTLTEFQVSFPDEATCAAFLFKQRWPEGFVCPVCHPMIPTPRDFVPEHRRLLKRGYLSGGRAMVGSERQANHFSNKGLSKPGDG